MKTTIFTLCVLSLLCTTSALGQSAPVLSNNPQVTQMSEHPQHAEVHAMAPETTLLGPNPYTYARGEQPLSEYGYSPAYETPLGDVARAYRKQHGVTTAKAVKSLER